MRYKTILLWTLPVAMHWISTLAIAQDTAETNPSVRVRIGADIRFGFQSCIDYWTPVTERLSREIPEHRFVIVPLASHQDLIRVLEGNGVDFLALDPAMELMGEDRYGMSPLATMTEAAPGQTPPSPESACRGAIVRRTDRNDLLVMDNMRGWRMAAVKPWSLTGWISQWGLMMEHGIDPHRDLAQVSFEGTHGEVIRRVLDGAADLGAVDADWLAMAVKAGHMAPDDLYILNREGRFVPLIPGATIASTTAYPGRLLSKTAAVPDDLAKRVVEVLQSGTVETTLDGMTCEIRWVAPSNYSKIRRLLQSLMGMDFAESQGFPLPTPRPAWLFPVQLFGIALGVVFLAVAAVRRYYRRRDELLRGQIQDAREELTIVRAELQRGNAIMALAGCWIDIVDDENHLIYADASLENRFGDWHGRKCHEIYCDSDTPCPQCQRPFPINEHCGASQVHDCTHWATIPINAVEEVFERGKSMWMIGVPFRDEGGRWLHARIHFPIDIEQMDLNRLADTASKEIDK